MSKTRFSIRETLRAGIIPYRNLFPFLRPYVPQFVVALVCGGLFAAATVCVPLVIKLVSAHAFSPSSDQVGMVGNTNADDVKNAILFCSVIPLIFIVRSAFDFLNSYLMAWVSMRELPDLRTKVYCHILTHSLDSFSRERPGMRRPHAL